MSSTLNEFRTHLDAAQRSAVHLEMRDSYAVGDEAEDFANWKATGVRDVDPDTVNWKPWVSTVAETISRGIVMRRARIVSTPVSQYIAFEHAGTPVNVGAGEQVRWLARRDASGIALPASDLWIFDETTVMFNHFDGTGDWAESPLEVTRDPAVVELCRTAFEAVWARATPHDEFVI